MMWMPRFVCPECHCPIGVEPAPTCPCGRAYELRDGIHRFLSEARQLANEPFAAQYRRVRQADGHRAVIAGRGWELPYLPRGHQAEREWRIRRESYEHLLARVIGSRSRRVLDLGAGSGWLSARLAALGHDVVALDRLDDDADAAAMRRLEAPAFVAVEADFNALPFVPSQFDVVVFNASLHYSANPARTLGAAAAMLRAPGCLVVMDSPMFESAPDGEAMVTMQLARLAATLGIGHAIRPGLGYLTFEQLDGTARRLGRRSSFVPSVGPFAWRARRHFARLRLKRAPAEFGVWTAR